MIGSTIDRTRSLKRQEDENQKREGKFNHKLAFEMFDMGQKRKASFPPLFQNNVEIKENIKA